MQITFAAAWRAGFIIACAWAKAGPACCQGEDQPDTAGTQDKEDNL